jgi:hypothetical protein
MNRSKTQIPIPESQRLTGLGSAWALGFGLLDFS